MKIISLFIVFVLMFSGCADKTVVAPPNYTVKQNNDNLGINVFFIGMGLAMVACAFTGKCNK